MDVVTLGAALKGAKAYTDATIAPLLGGVHYRGSVNYYTNLPSSPSEGDAYTVKYIGTSGTTPDGTEYVWALDTDDNTYKWIGFSPDTYTKTEIDSALSGKQDTIDSTHKLNADNVDDTNSTNKFATAAELEQIETNKTNISTLQGKVKAHSEGGTDHDVINGIRVYVSATQPTGDIPTGSLWIGG